MGLDSRVRARVRFLSFFKVGFGFYPVGFRVYVGFQFYVRKRHILGKKSKEILASENFSTFFSNLKKNYFIKWFEHRFIHELEIFWFFLANMVDFCPKIAVFNPYKTLRVLSGFDVGFGFGSGLC